MVPFRILIADDHALFRAGLKAILLGMREVEVVGEASDGRQAISMVSKTRPHLVLVDIAMKGMNGLELTSQITKKFPQVKVLILSMHADESYVLTALKRGAHGYIIKDADPEELALAIKAVRRGDVYLSPSISRQVVEEFRRRTAEELNPVDQLSPRQREILQLIAEGHTTKDIARILNLSVKTVDSHRTQLMNRLNIHDLAGLVRFAIQWGITGGEK